MLYCTYDQYAAAGGTVPEAAFGVLCSRASRLIDAATFGRAEHHAAGCEPCREALADSRPLPQFQAELSFRVTYNEGGFWSLYTQIREPAADGHILLRRWGDTWDLRRGYPVSLPSFFPHRRGWKRRLLTLAAQEIQRQETAGYARYLDGWLRRLRQQFNPMRFYLTPEGLAFFYPMYAIAPAAEGIPVFTVPYEAVGPYVPVSKAEPSSSAPQT